MSLRAAAPTFQPRGNRSSKQTPPRHSTTTKRIPLALANFHFVFSPQSALAACCVGDVLQLDVEDIWNDTVLVEYCAAYDVVCPLCLDAVQLGEALPCGHVFCQVCIRRCLRFAEEDNPILLKCAVCMDGRLHSSLLRRCVVHKQPEVVSYTLVRAVHESELVPRTSQHPSAFASRFKVASGEFMLHFVQQRRVDLASARADLKRFRDEEGLLALAKMDRELDGMYVEWTRLLVDGSAAAAKETTPAAVFFYQNANGLMRFVHDVNLKTLDLVLPAPPAALVGLPVLEVNDAATSALPGAGQRIPASHLVPSTAYFVELDLSSLQLPNKAVDASRKLVQERARRRRTVQDKQAKAELTLTQQAQREQDARVQARQEEERLLLDFFGYTEQRLRDEAEERSRIKASVRPTAFSAVVSHMGHFPALPSSSKPHAAAAPVAAAAAAAATPPPSFSQATSSSGKKKKVPFFTNNPADRRG